MNLNPIALIYKNFHNFFILRHRNLNLAKQSALLLTAVILLFVLLDLFTLIEIIHQQRSAFMSKLTRFKKIGALFLGIPIYGILYLHLIRYLKIYDKLDKEEVYYLTKKPHLSGLDGLRAVILISLHPFGAQKTFDWLLAVDEYVYSFHNNL